MVSVRVLRELYELYLEYDLKVLKQEIKDRNLNRDGVGTMKQIVALVMEYGEEEYDGNIK